jgi:uncharacterized membrane protein YdjX (TVP38/TMEM64 family)
VSYLAGFARIEWRPFLLATLLGMMPSTIALTLIGSGLLPARYQWVLIVTISLVLVVAAVLTQWLVIPRLLRRAPPRGPTG